MVYKLRVDERVTGSLFPSSGLPRDRQSSYNPKDLFTPEELQEDKRNSGELQRFRDAFRMYGSD